MRKLAQRELDNPGGTVVWHTSVEEIIAKLEISKDELLESLRMPGRYVGSQPESGNGWDLYESPGDLPGRIWVRIIAPDISAEFLVIRYG